MPLKQSADNGLYQECVWGPVRGILQEVTNRVGHFPHCLDGHFCDAGCYAIVTRCAMLCYAQRCGSMRLTSGDTESLGGSRR